MGHTSEDNPTNADGELIEAEMPTRMKISQYFPNNIDGVPRSLPKTTMMKTSQNNFHPLLLVLMIFVDL